jgi:serine acetyltransferase
VTKDVPENVTVVGVPARIVSRREPGWHLHV